jgi:hypothetical protein
MLPPAEAAELARLYRERLAILSGADEPPEQRWAGLRAELVAAFGEADVAAAKALNAANDAAEKTTNK